LYFKGARTQASVLRKRAGYFNITAMNASFREMAGLARTLVSCTQERVHALARGIAVTEVSGPRAGCWALTDQNPLTSQAARLRCGLRPRPGRLAPRAANTTAGTRWSISPRSRAWNLHEGYLPRFVSVCRAGQWGAERRTSRRFRSPPRSCPRRGAA
jgi:hypothetical protein